jgi:hypothetical protein
MVTNRQWFGSPLQPEQGMEGMHLEGLFLEHSLPCEESTALQDCYSEVQVTWKTAFNVYIYMRETEREREIPFTHAM